MVRLDCTTTINLFEKENRHGYARKTQKSSSLGTSNHRRKNSSVGDWKENETEIEILEIWKERTRGARNEIKPYLHQKAVDPFWKHIEEKYPEELSTYKQHTFKLSFKSLKDLLLRISFFCSDIATAKSYGRTNVEEISRFSSGRLPFIEEEWAILKKIVKSLTK